MRVLHRSERPSLTLVLTLMLTLVLTLVLTLDRDNGGSGGENLACESGAAAGRETGACDQTPAFTQVAMAVSGAANPATRLIQEDKVFFPPFMRSDDVSLCRDVGFTPLGHLGLKGATFTAHEHEAT